MLIVKCLIIFASLVFSFDYNDNFEYRVIARGTDAPEVSHKEVGRIEFTIDIPFLGRTFVLNSRASGYFAVHQGADGSEKFYFLTAAHIFDINDTGVVVEYYTEPARDDDNFLLLSKGKISIYYGSVKIADQKKFLVFPNGQYQPNNPGVYSGEAHLVRIDSRYPFGVENRTDPNLDIAAIELTDAQKVEFVQNGGKFVRSKDDSPMKDFQVGEVCKIGGWGVLNVTLKPQIQTTRMQEANIVAKERSYCTAVLEPGSPVYDVSKFACFSTHFGRDEDPYITNRDSGSPVICGTGDGLLATMISSTDDQFVVFGPTRETIFAFLKASFYDN